jgi:DNA-binding MarR family transcriptional regulator
MPGLPDDLPPPRSPRLRQGLEVNLRLLEAADRLREHWNAHARRHGLSAAQVKALLNIAGDEAVTMRTLAARLRYDASNLTTLIDRLQHAGLVERRSPPSDRRVTQVALTASGRRARDEFWSALNAGGPLDPLTDAQIRALNDALATVLGEPSTRET